LAGYVWDMKNPFVRDHKVALQKLARIIELGMLADEEI